MAPETVATEFWKLPSPLIEFPTIVPAAAAPVEEPLGPARVTALDPLPLVPPPLVPPPPNPLGAPAPKTIAAISLLQIFIVSLLEKFNWATQAL